MIVITHLNFLSYLGLSGNMYQFFFSCKIQILLKLKMSILLHYRTAPHSKKSMNLHFLLNTSVVTEFSD